MLREECRLPYGVIQRYLKWRYRLCLSVGELVALVRGVARLGQEEYNRLQQEIRASPVVYGDETGWREAGRNGYLWSFSNPEVRYFLRRGSRGSKVVAEVLGDEFDGVLVSGFYGAYLDFTQNPGKVMDDITFVRSHWWLVSEGFSLSTANSDVQKLPATLYHRIADSLAYAA